MAEIKVRKIKAIRGEFIAPADKSISQRAIMVSSLAKGKTRIDNFLKCDDSLRAIDAFRKMGVKIKLIQQKGKSLIFTEGRGVNGLRKPYSNLYIGNSGTTMRIICGILAGQKFDSVLTGDASLSRRPMKRIFDPLRMMGADLRGKKINQQEFPPIVIKGRSLQAIKYQTPVNSAQVKSSILFAGLFAKGRTCILEKLKTRDHTERMLRLFGADISIKKLAVAVSADKILKSPGSLYIPGDISSCAFFIMAALLLKGSHLLIKNVGINPTRTGLLKILKRMGADIVVKRNKRALNAFEPYADILVRSSVLKATVLDPEDVAYCIDELPIICVGACFAKGTTKIIGAAELRVKETDRIYSMVTNLKKMGAKIKSAGNDLIIQGTGKLKAAKVKSFGDHRTAMCLAVAGLLTEGQTTVENTDCVNKSFPDFERILENITQLT
ncbi:MAG: 3-phosphoshikimate 1-carboxyvinyltransferase [Candidatus Omnitrophica bacterium]|nr:3-phosphoshikimate 1-carboxyvinyltransferase [Candidatus Omnitrophota bacterium]